MLAGEALGRWLKDDAAQNASKTAIEAFGKNFRSSGPMGDLGKELEAVARDDAEGIMAAAESFLDKTDLIDSAMLDLLRASAADPYFRPPLRRVFSPVHLGLLLLDNPKLSILLALTSPDALAAKRIARKGPASITFGGQRSIFKFLKAGGAILSFWEAPPIGDGFTAEANARCRKVEQRRIEDGETFHIDGRRQSFVVEHAVSDIVYVQALTPAGAAPVSVEYDSDDLNFVSASSTDEIGSRVQMMVSLLRLLDRQDAAPLIRECLASPHFYVRWHVMREFLALDADLALPSLREMAESDLHPEVRAAAAQTLAAFFPDQGASGREDELCRA